jgi:hypothetical protein
MWRGDSLPLYEYPFHQYHPQKKRAVCAGCGDYDEFSPVVKKVWPQPVEWM